MTQEYGTKVAGALRAVCQLHSDTSRFLVDFHNNRVRVGWTSVFGNTVTRDLTASLPTPFWMAEGVYRYYVKDSKPELAEGVTVSFFDYQGRSKQPLLLVAQIEYQLPSDMQINDVCKGWDIWDLYFTWNQNADLEKVISTASMDRGRIEWANFIGVPLYSINRVEDAEQLMTKVRKVS